MGSLVSCLRRMALPKSKQLLVPPSLYARSVCLAAAMLESRAPPSSAQHAVPPCQISSSPTFRCSTPSSHQPAVPASAASSEAFRRSTRMLKATGMNSCTSASSVSSHQQSAVASTKGRTAATDHLLRARLCTGLPHSPQCRCHRHPPLSAAY
jgi:hypothetical protein